MKILFMDIETTPIKAYVWSMWKQNIGLNQVIEPSRMMCFAASWLGSGDVEFYAEVDTTGRRNESSRKTMLANAHRLLSEADVVCHYNGQSFDVPIINRDLAVAGYPPPAPFQQVDLMRVVKRHFRFMSNKLEHVSRQFGVGGKVQHEGFGLWERCLNGDPDAWADMQIYNERDVVLLEDLYKELLPWIDNGPNAALYNDIDGCPSCTSTNLAKDGYRYTKVGKYQRYRCQDCGRYSSSGRRVTGVDLR